MAERNALAELAERLETHIVPIAGCVGGTETGRGIAKDVGTAQRIIAELAKVEYLTCDGAIVSTILSQANQAVIKCRAIAEEGAKDAK